MTGQSEAGGERASHAMAPARAVRLLLAEDEPNLGQIVETFLTGRGYSVLRVSDGRAALAALDRVAFDVAVLDVHMPEVDGLEVLRRAHERAGAPAFIIVTGNASVETSVAALALGAYDALAKPYRMTQLDALVRRAAEVRQLARRCAAARWGQGTATGAAGAFDAIVAGDPAMRAAVDAVRAAAVRGAPIVVTGLPGSGRGTLAVAAHRWSPRAGGPCVVVQATGDASLDAEGLFGRWAGAPATADPAAPAGAVELADGGTLVVRECDRLHPALARELAGAFHAGHHRRRGDGRLVASEAMPVLTASDGEGIDPTLADALRAWSAVQVSVPPLADRVADIAPLAHRLLAGPAPAASLEDGAIRALEGYGWPGNVAELRLVLELAAIRASGPLDAGAPMIGADDVYPLIGHGPVHAVGARPAVRAMGTVVQPMAAVEREAITDALRAAGWHQGRASRMLGLSPRTLYRKIRAYGLERPGRGRGDDDGGGP